MAAFWLDVIKTLIGTFIGAGLAFASNIWFQSRQRKHSRIMAGNLALLVLKRQLDDFYNVRRGFRLEFHERHGSDTGAPYWMHFRPLAYPFVVDATFNFESLAFLFEKGNAQVVDRLNIAEGRHADLRGVVERHAQFLLQIQDKMTTFDVRPDGSIDVAAAEAHLGRMLVAQGNTITEGLYTRFERDEADYLRAIEDLRKALVKMFGEKAVVQVEPVKDFEKALRSAGIAVHETPASLKPDARTTSNQ